MNAEIYSHDELDQILRGDGRGDFVGISAIDGLIAAVVAGPVLPTPSRWLPSIFGRYGSPALFLCSYAIDRAIRRRR